MGFKKLAMSWPPNKKFWLCAAFAAIVVSIALFAFLSWRSSSLSVHLTASPPNGIALVEKLTTPVTPARMDRDDYRKVLDNGRLSLLLHEPSSRFIVRQASDSYEWSSNPAWSNETAGEMSASALADHKSPFILEYHLPGGVQRRTFNASHDGLEIGYIYEHSRVEVHYNAADLGIAFCIRYELGSDGFTATVPFACIGEGANKIVSIRLLPFFGAVEAHEADSYLFVPDGPGGLIHVKPDRANVAKQYLRPVYGPSVTAGNAQMQLKVPSKLNIRGADPDDDFEPPVAYPVYGIKRGQHAMTAIIASGASNAWIRAIPAGVFSDYFSVSAEFVYREEYSQRLSRMGHSTSVFEERAAVLDASIEWRFRTGDRAGYAGMAGIYRDYLIREGMISDVLTPSSDYPVDLTIVGGGMAKQAGTSRKSFVAVTDFGEAAAIVEDLHASGIRNMRLTYAGWFNDDSAAPGSRQPARKLGGVKGLERLSKIVRETSSRLYLADNYVYVNAHSRLSERSYGVRSIEGTVWFNRKGQYVLNPSASAALLNRALPALSGYGIDGLQLAGFGDTLFSDYKRNREQKRRETMLWYDQALGQTRQALGAAGVYYGFAYSIEHVDRILELPLEGTNHYLVDESVPFYPMVLHGRITYSSVPINLTGGDRNSLLKAIEYGAVPSFALTASTSRLLKDSEYANLFSTRYEAWKEEIVRTYAQFGRIAGLMNVEIVDHARVGEETFETTYADGTKVTVDYAQGEFRVSKEVGP